jgi:hypothetical protein
LNSLGLLDTAAEIARWEADHRKAQAEREGKARQKQGINSNLQFAPVPITKAPSAEYVAKLYLLTQKRNMAPIFEYEDLGTQLFNATLKLNDQVFKADGPYTNKKAAKEAAAKLGVNHLTQNPSLVGSSSTMATSSLSGRPTDTVELNERTQKLRIATPEYLYNEISKGQFSVSMILAGTTFEEQGPFQSKKLAKESISKLGLAHLQYVSTPTSSGTSLKELDAKLQSLVDRYRLDRAIFNVIELVETPLKYRAELSLDGETFEDAGPFVTKQEAACAITKQGIIYLENKYIENQEDWISLLNIFSSATSGGTTHQQPIYEDFQETTTRQSLWSSELTIPQRAELFGCRDLPFGSKKLARQNAAREAVLWLREQGHLSADGTPKKKQKRNSSSASGSPPESPTKDGISYTQQVQGKT